MRSGSFIREVAVFLTIIFCFTAYNLYASDYNREILSQLSDAEILYYLNTVDAPLSSKELGAKYIWGHIPLDRSIPDEIGLWWERLNREQKNLKKIEYFKNNLSSLKIEDIEKVITLDRLRAEAREEIKTEKKVVTPWWVREKEEKKPEPSPKPAVKKESVKKADTARLKKPPVLTKEEVKAAAPKQDIKEVVQLPASEVKEIEVQITDKKDENEIIPATGHEFVPTSLRNY